MKNFSTFFLLPLFLLLVLPLLAAPAFAQDAPAVKQEAPAPTVRRSLTAVRVEQAPRIDAALTEEVWQLAPAAANFIQNRPSPGKQERHRTEVRLLYDDVALYIGARMYDVSADSIMRELSKRDNITNTDFFGVFLDTYNDKLNGYGFIVTPSGVQIDARYSSNGEDWSWNAVWESKAALEGNDWVVEMKIPYSAVRFSKETKQVWGLNFMRNHAKTREAFFWNEVKPETNGFLNQWGLLEGLENIKSPLRLSLTPYVSAYVENYPYNVAGKRNTSTAYNGGLDVKYGLNESFTLDLTLVPDFGQVQSDNQVLNLTPFEVQFNENRPFFIEGTELFNKGNFFYSRRIGGTPKGYHSVGNQLQPGERVLHNPMEARLINASKLSGRTKQGLGIGLFNATTAPAFAIVENGEDGTRRRVETQPLTNYNILVLDQSLKNNSYVSFINTNVMRQGSLYDANLTGGLFELNTKKNTYSINGRGALSQQYGLTERPHLGYTYSVSGGKTSGKIQYRLSHRVESDTYNPNDLGILLNNNQMEQAASVRYLIFKPVWRINRLFSNLGVTYTQLFNPNTFQNFHVNGNANTTFKNFWSTGLFFRGQPRDGYDFFLPRVQGHYYRLPPNLRAGGFLSSDFRKKYAAEVEAIYHRFDENDRHTLGFFAFQRYRFSNQFSLNHNLQLTRQYDDIGFPVGLPAPAPGEPIIFGRRDVNTTTNTLTGNYIFTNRMSLSLRVRHYWSKAAYHQFYHLTEQGRLQPSRYTGDHNINYNAFNVDMVYSWWFAPGSEISIVWKNAILNQQDALMPDYFQNLSHTLQAPQHNSLSIKLLYYLDYQDVRERLKRI